MMTDGAVLVLNQNYEPMSVCSVRRAVVLQLLGKAEVVETYDGQRVRAVSLSLPRPSVVRLSWYANVPYKRILLTRKNIIRRDGHICQYCGDSKGAMTVDHVIPKRLGGADSWENLVCACARCNNRKGDQPPEDVGLKLAHPPRRPNQVTFIQRFIGISDNRWKPYLFLD